MKTGPQSKLNPKIRENMENLLGSQLALLDSHLKSWNDEWRNTVRSAFSTMSSDMDRLKHSVELRMQDTTGQINQTTDQIRTQITSLEQQSRKLSHLIAGRSLTIFLSGAALATLMSFAGSFLAVTMMITSQQVTEPRAQQVPAALQGSRTLRGAGGLGEVTMLPPTVTLARCPIGNGSGRICIQDEED